eukprot:5174850-Amphidinium_carterae.1
MQFTIFCHTQRLTNPLTRTLSMANIFAHTGVSGTRKGSANAPARRHMRRGRERHPQHRL